MSDGVAREPVRRRRRWLLAVLSGALYFAAFPPLDLGLLAFVAVAPLLLALRGASAARAFLLAWLAGTVLSTALVSASIYEAASRYFGGGGLVLLLFALVIPQIHGALYFAVFGVLVRGWERRAPLAVLGLVPAAWTACEFARASVGYGTPWCLLGHSQHDRTWMLQIADLAGVFGVSFVVAEVNVLLALCADALERRRARPLLPPVAATAALLLLVWAYGERQLERWQPTRLARPGIRVLLVQPNLETRGRASLAAVPANLRRLSQVTSNAGSDASSPPADVVVWPENAIGFSLAANPSLLRLATRDLAPAALLLLGAPREIAVPQGAAFRNSAFLLDRAGEIVATYDKLRLTPFAETSPWAELGFPRRRFGAGDLYTPGERLQLSRCRR